MPRRVAGRGWPADRSRRGCVRDAIHRAAGPGLLEECRRIGGCPTGEARITGGYPLRARHVIHTVGLVWRGGGCSEPALLAACYRNSLVLAVRHGLRTVAFPAISCGVCGYPVRDAARIAVATVTAVLAAEPSIQRADLVCFNPDIEAAYRDAGRRLARGCFRSVYARAGERPSTARRRVARTP